MAVSRAIPENRGTLALATLGKTATLDCPVTPGFKGIRGYREGRRETRAYRVTRELATLALKENKVILAHKARRAHKATQALRGRRDKTATREHMATQEQKARLAILGIKARQEILARVTQVLREIPGRLGLKVTLGSGILESKEIQARALPIQQRRSVRFCSLWMARTSIENCPSLTLRGGW
jgi:hypothetical protein